MTQILNVPMPADEAIKIIRCIYESNRMINIYLKVYDDEDGIHLVTVVGLRERDIIVERWNPKGMDKLYEFLSPDDKVDIKIDDIGTEFPKYKVWDEVMILATGEIGEIIRQDRQYARDCYISFPDDKIWHRWENFHRSEICKIA